MIGNREEYQKMHFLEEKLWWYKILHEQVLEQIQEKFGDNKTIKILDAGCGTGGMLAFLRKNGYINITGFDISEDGVSFCEEKGLKVNQLDIRKLKNVYKEKEFDVVICNDMLYFLNDEEIIKTIKEFLQIIDKQGVVLINIHAFEIFSGTHDIAVGSNRRFVLTDFEKYVTQAAGKIQYATYWSLLLSPLILGVRVWQNLILKIGLIKEDNIQSDVNYPGDFINNLLYQVVKIERKIIKKIGAMSKIFGSSLLMKITKNNTV